MVRRFIHALAIGLALSLYVGEAHALVQLKAPKGAADERFGTAIAIDADTLIVGAPSFERQGAAYVFARTGTRWSLQQVLRAEDGGVGDLFGISIALDGNTALIGATRAPDPAEYFRGAVYAFERVGGTWIERQRVSPSIGYIYDWFGGAVALSGDTALVGAAQEFGDPGMAFFFRYEGGSWVETQRVDGSEWEQLGSSVALDGDTAVLGGPNADTYAGAAYVYVNDGADFVLQERLTASTPAYFSGRFGTAVAIESDTVMVGSLGEAGPDDTVLGGAVHVFARAGDVWTERQKLVGMHAPGDDFGAALALSGSLLLVGAPGETIRREAQRGAAYLFTRDGDDNWTRTTKALAPRGAEGDAFGGAVAIDGRTFAIGAPYDDVGGRTNRGSVYVMVR